MNWPIEQIYQELDQILLNSDSCAGQCVIIAPPGAGKSTLLPLHLLSIIKDRLIILVEPRRIAARAVARRMASLLGEKVGKTVGYAMRMEQKTSSKTRILVVTEGVFTHMLLENPELDTVGAVLFDEFHERALDADFGLALAIDIRSALCPDLKLIVMSATLDGARIAKLMGDAPILETQGRQFDVEIRYCPHAPNERLEQVMAKTIIQTVLTQTNGNILAFLPGQREIERTISLLKSADAKFCLPSHIMIAPLYGSLSGKEQDLAISAPTGGKRKVVLATSIAQTSLTIEDINIVIDSGLARRPIYEPALSLTRLETRRATIADIEQRAGRAGRTRPGIAIRLWHEGQTQARPAYAPPEILQTDLTDFLLNCTAFGILDPTQLALLDPPPIPTLNGARQFLRYLGAIGEDNRITAKGELMRRLGLPIRYAHMVASTTSQQAAQMAAELALLLSDHSLSNKEIDIELAYQNFKRSDYPHIQKIKQKSVKIAKKTLSFQNVTKKTTTQQISEPLPSIQSLLLQAWPDRVARARGSGGQFLMGNGRGAQIDAAHPLAKEPWLLITDIAGKARNANIIAALSIDEAVIRTILADQITTDIITTYDASSKTIRACAQEKLAAVSLAERTMPTLSGEAAVKAWCQAIRQHGLDILPWDKDSYHLRQRLSWLHKNIGTSWPNMLDAPLIDTVEDWLASFLPVKANLQNEKSFLSQALIARLPYELQSQFGQLAPAFFITPLGTKIALDYEQDIPILRVRVQELFGLNTHPTIAGGRIKLCLELLSPALRPIQITRDLPGFWQGSWHEVRAQMRSRYPKHVWPQDPSSATPTKRTKSKS